MLIIGELYEYIYIYIYAMYANIIELNMIFNRALAPVTSFKANPLSDSNSIQTTTILLF